MTSEHSRSKTLQKLEQGAEAIVYRTDSGILKDRCVKKYRHPSLDKSLRKSRTKREAKVLEKLQAAQVPVPKLLSLDADAGSLQLQFIEAPKLRDVIHNTPQEYAKELGQLIAQVHGQGIIHGDLSTSNVLAADKLTLIDFGLSFFSEHAEDRAVDLHVFEQIVNANHTKDAKVIWEAFCEGYKTFSDAHTVLNRLEKVRSRGRHKLKH